MRRTVRSLITVVNGRKLVGVRTRSSNSVFGNENVLATEVWTAFLVDVSLTYVPTGSRSAFCS